ncbi:MAG: LysR substrate-binding domain-containing protein [Acidimicrobiales bacterium]
MVTPPAVSAALATLQRELGVALVVREGRGLRVSPAGEVFAGYARQLLGLMEEARLAAAGHMHPERGRVRLAAVNTVGEYVVPAVLAQFRARYPDAEVALEVGNRAHVWDLLAHRQVDLAIGGRPPSGGRLTTLATRPTALVLVAATRTARPKGRRRWREVGAAELEKQVWLLREPGSGTRAATEEFLGELGIEPRSLMLGSNGSIRESVQVGLGVTLAARESVEGRLARRTLEEWRCPGLPRPRAWHVVARAGEEPPATARLLVQHLISGDRSWLPWAQTA